MKYTLVVLILIIAVFAHFLLKGQFKNTPSVLIANIYFKAEIAKTDEEKATGLAKYKKIDNDFVMIFPFNTPGYYTFWMKDMKFPIDIIYVNKGKIVDIFSNVPAPINKNSELPIIRPSERSDNVLEINAGLSKNYKFKKGDKIYIKY